VWTGEAEIFKMCGFQSFEDESESLVAENGGGLNGSTQHSAQTYIFIENKS
jgi:hypothetical protein